MTGKTSCFWFLHTSLSFGLSYYLTQQKKNILHIVHECGGILPGETQKLRLVTQSTVYKPAALEDPESLLENADPQSYPQPTAPYSPS